MNKEAENFIESILPDLRKFSGIRKWKYCKDFFQIKNDNYRILDIEDLDNVIDIGACIGEFSYACGKRFPKAKIYTVECNPDAIIYLSNNLKRVENVETHYCAIGPSGMKFNIDHHKKNLGSCRVKFSKSNNFMGMEMISLRDFISKNNIVNLEKSLLKIDCEGFEKYIINDLDLVSKFYQISAEFHEKIMDIDKEVVDFLNFMSNSHDIISGSRVAGGIYEIVLRRR